MTKVDIVRAWKDAEYRLSLSAAEQALLPAHPAGAIELDEGELAQVAGALATWSICLMISCLSCGGPDCYTVTLA